MLSGNCKGRCRLGTGPAGVCSPHTCWLDAEKDTTVRFRMLGSLKLRRLPCMQYCADRGHLQGGQRQEAKVHEANPATQLHSWHQGARGKVLWLGIAQCSLKCSAMHPCAETWQSIFQLAAAQQVLPSSGCVCATGKSIGCRAASIWARYTAGCL